jgi:hypothetical protein
MIDKMNGHTDYVTGRKLTTLPKMAIVPSIAQFVPDLDDCARLYLDGMILALVATTSDPIYILRTRTDDQGIGIDSRLERIRGDVVEENFGKKSEALEHLVGKVSRMLIVDVIYNRGHIHGKDAPGESHEHSIRIDVWKYDANKSILDLIKERKYGLFG